MKEISTAINSTAELTSKQSLHCRVKRTDCPHSNEASTDTTFETSPSRPFRLGMVPLVFELYDRIAPELRAKLQQFFDELTKGLRIDNVEVIPCELVSNLSHLKRVCQSFSNQEVDTILITHLAYVPSGQILEALMEVDVPVLLWPAQAMERIEAEELDSLDVFLNHSVHGTMDLANVLRRAKRPYGVVHGHWKEPKFRSELVKWLQVGATLRTLRTVNPLVIGERFPDMLDLRMEDEPFMQTLGISPIQVPLSEFVEIRQQINESAVLEVYDGYHDRFEIAPSLDEPLLLRSAKNELVLRHLLEKYQSRALAVNFLDVCNDPEIADSLHLPVSNLMAEGIGYGAEVDWETASLIAALQAVLGNARVGFTEIFSVDYGENRVLLQHWGEGNTAQAAGKPRVIKSVLNDISTCTAFPICDFHFHPGKYSLLNLSVTPEGQGQIITIPGTVEETRLPNCDGVKALFRGSCADVRELLNRYATLGGSHHLVMIGGDIAPFVEKLAQQTGWSEEKIE